MFREAQHDMLVIPSAMKWSREILFND